MIRIEFVSLKLTSLLLKIIYISFAIYYRLCSVLQIKYLLSFGSKLHLLPKVNCSFQYRYRVLNYTIGYGFHYLLLIAQSR